MIMISESARSDTGRISKVEGAKKKRGTKVTLDKNGRGLTDDDDYNSEWRKGVTVGYGSTKITVNAVVSIANDLLTKYKVVRLAFGAISSFSSHRSNAKCLEPKLYSAPKIRYQRSKINLFLSRLGRQTSQPRRQEQETIHA